MNIYNELKNILTKNLKDLSFRGMTNLLEKAFETISRESLEVQDWIASLILEEILAEKAWELAFSNSPSILQKLATSAFIEIESGNFEEGGFDNL